MDHEITVEGDDMMVVDADGNRFHLSIEELKKEEYGKPITTEWAINPEDDKDAATEALKAAKVAADQYVMDHNL